MTTLELKHEIRTLFSDNARSIGWTTLILPFGLFFVSDFESQRPDLFWVLTFLQVSCAAGISWLCATLPKWPSSKFPVWDQLFYSMRLTLYTVVGVYLSIIFFSFEHLSWPGVIAIGMLIGSTEVLVATFHPNLGFAILSLGLFGAIPIAFATVRLNAEGKSLWIALIGLLYLLVSTQKLLSAHRRFVQNAHLRIDNIKYQSRLKSILDAMPAKISHLDSEFHYLEVNQTMVEAYGKTKNEYIGHKVGFHDKERANPLLQLLTNFQNSADQLLTTESAFEINGAEPRLHTIQIKKIPIPTSTPPEKYEYILVSIDVSDHQKVKNQLDQEKLRFAQAAKLSSVGEVAAGIAHELKQPLTVILGNLSLIKNDFTANKLNAEKFETRIETLIKTTNRMNQTIKSILRLTRSSGTSAHEWTHMDQVIMDPLALCGERFRMANVTLKINPLPENLELLCDPQQLGQVILNLLNNAFDATEEASAAREVQLHSNINANGDLQIVVSDNGPGAKDPSKLFGSFYTTKKEGHGTGLGLSLCRRIMEQHKAQISYQRLNPSTNSENNSVNNPDNNSFNNAARSLFILDFPSTLVRKSQSIAA
jgi:signal transduction histidine kinase